MILLLFSLIFRFAMNHPKRVAGVVLINCNPEKGESGLLDMFKGARKGSSGDWLDKGINVKNIAKYTDSYRRREEIVSILGTKMTTETLLMTGSKNKEVKGSEEIHRLMKTGLSTIIKLEDVDNVLDEAEAKVVDAVILFCQGVGMMPTVQRKMSRQLSIPTKETIQEEDDNPKLNMTR